MALICKKNITPSIFIPYGLEIELENVEFEYGKRVISHKIPNNWKVGIDRSLLKDGIEISSDVLRKGLKWTGKLSNGLTILII